MAARAAIGAARDAAAVSMGPAAVLSPHADATEANATSATDRSSDDPVDSAHRELQWLNSEVAARRAELQAVEERLAAGRAAVRAQKSQAAALSEVLRSAAEQGHAGIAQARSALAEAAVAIGAVGNLGSIELMSPASQRLEPRRGLIAEFF